MPTVRPRLDLKASKSRLPMVDCVCPSSAPVTGSNRPAFTQHARNCLAQVRPVMSFLFSWKPEVFPKNFLYQFMSRHPARFLQSDDVKPEEPAYVVHSTSKVEAPRRKLALTLERGAYWRKPRRVRIPINESIDRTKRGIGSVPQKGSASPHAAIRIPT
jgi:hypothetical protein